MRAELSAVSSPNTDAVSRRKRLPGLTVADGYTRHPFDEKHGVRTSGLVPGRYLNTGHKNDKHNTAYYGVAPSVFRTMIGRWRRAPQLAPIDEYTFVDMGAGMGRALLLASEYRFRRVIGVELHPYLARVAQKNLSIWRKAELALAPSRVVCSDVLDFFPPAGRVVCFLFNPFGAGVLKPLVKKLAAQYAGHPGQLDLIYVNNEHEDVLEMAPGFTRLFIGAVQRSRNDAIADHRILANQLDGEYASANYENCSIWRYTGVHSVADPAD